MKNEETAFGVSQLRMKNWGLCIALVALMSSCVTKTYQVQSIKSSVVLIDSSFGKNVNREMVVLLDSYKSQLTQKMSTVIGEAARTLTKAAPKHELVSFTADVMKQYGDAHGGADLSFMNIEGHRAALNKGEITIGSMFEIYSFENALVFLDLKGEYLAGIFDQFAKTEPQGFSSNVQLTVQNNKVVSVLIDGKELDKNKTYRIVTLDYLAEGNDNMTGLKKATSINQTDITLRDMMIDYVKQCTARGEKINSL